jgi:hypothetical protein
VYANIDLITAIRMERERSIRDDRLTRLAARLRDCCRSSLISRFARAMGRSLATRQEPTR